MVEIHYTLRGGVAKLSVRLVAFVWGLQAFQIGKFQIGWCLFKTKGFHWS